MMQSKTGAIPPDGGALPSANLADDILLGANQIAEFLFGDRRARRKVYHLVLQLSFSFQSWSAVAISSEGLNVDI
jgi:hypothetical protein